ncbi:MAG: tRNA1(Val) (adenine(37)-N6)-methyltransferase [Eubacterium sp.]|nr:tRNA1(Val) (adenine(37)-N6)-methyltransferase [Eubacterium sp.]
MAERIDDLQRKGFKIIQDDEMFCFGTDAVLLCHFARLKPGDRAVDLGCGNGVIGLLLCSLYDNINVTGLEIQPKAAELAKRNISLNGIENRMRIVLGDISRISDYFPVGEADVVITNPPYMKAQGSLKNESEEKRLARHEILCSLNDVVKAAAYLLKFGGRFFMVHKPERLCEIFEAMKGCGIEPKRLRLVQSNSKKEPSMALIEGAKGGKPGLRVMPALVISGDDGRLNNEYEKIYNSDETVLI